MAGFLVILVHKVVVLLLVITEDSLMQEEEGLEAEELDFIIVQIGLNASSVGILVIL